MRVHSLAPLALVAVLGCSTSTLSPAEAPITHDGPVAAETPEELEAAKTAPASSADPAAQEAVPAPPPGQYEMAFTPTEETAPPAPTAKPRPRKGWQPPPTVHKRAVIASPSE